MAKRQKPLVVEIARRLDITPAPDSPNRITARDLRGWAVEYLGDYYKELARHPELVGQSHWNLWMMDARLEDALFVVLIFRTDGVEFFCGVGNAFKIKRFAESDFPDDPEQVLPEMEKRFSIPAGSLRLDRRSARRWLGRSW